MKESRTNAFLVGFHEERTEPDPVDPQEPWLLQNVIPD